MAFLNSSEVSFEEIRIILCPQSYYIMKEIGYWNRTSYWSIPFITEYEKEKLTKKDRITINYLVRCHHGIPIDIQPEYGLNEEDVLAAIKTLYLISNESENSERIYIGICDDINLHSYLNRCGFSHLAINLREIFN